MCSAAIQNHYKSLMFNYTDVADGQASKFARIIASKAVDVKSVASKAVDSWAVDTKASLSEAVCYMFKPTSEAELRAIVAKNLRAIRALRAISQEDLAALAGVHRTFVSQVERELKNISIDSLRKLANALSVDVHVLLQH